MAKKKKFIADKVRKKKTETQKKVNPFEVKINRQKHNILGRKLGKQEHGAPGQSRSRAIKRRNETLLQEYKEQHKANKLVDRRFGEHDASLSVDEKMLRRFALERERNTGGNKFSLNDDEELTHYGQSLSQIEKFDDPEVSDEDEDDAGKISGDMVAQEHFGGFLTRKDPSSSIDDKRSWKEKMEEVIANSKKAKYERQSEKEKTMEMTEQLDQQWKDVAQLLGLSSKSAKEEKKSTVDDYDITVRELKYELKGKATDRLKTEEEMAKDEKEKLEKLEADRVRRMKGILEDQEKPQHSHYSADSLDDGFILDSDDQDRGRVRFQDGGSEDEGKEGSEEGEGSPDSDGEGSEDEDSEGDGDSEDSYADIHSDSEQEEKEEEEEAEMEEETEGMTKVKSILKKNPVTDEENKRKEEIRSAAAKELPYIFKAPATYDDLEEMLHDRSNADQLTIIERVRKCHHASLAEGNNLKMQTFLSLLLQHYGNMALQDTPNLSLLDQLTRHIYELTQTFPNTAAEAMQNIIQEKQSEFVTALERKKAVIGLDTLLYLKLVPILFPTSDFSHPVSTPSLIFIGQLLSQSPVNTERDVACGLFMCSLCLEYVSQSKRFVPDGINFLHGVMFLAARKQAGKIERVFGPFKPVGKAVNLLLVKDPLAKSCETGKLKIGEVLGVAAERASLATVEFRVKLINCCVTLLSEFSQLYVDLAAHREIFSPVRYMCSKLPTKFYPQPLKEKIASLVSHIDETSKKPRQSLTFVKSKPKPLPLFEPEIEESFDGRRKKGGKDRAYNEKQKLLHKLKKEQKGAMREIRKDTQFLARHQLQETMEKDVERKRKVKALYGSLANQEGDYNSLKKKKKK